MFGLLKTVVAGLAAFVTEGARAYRARTSSSALSDAGEAERLVDVTREALARARDESSRLYVSQLGRHAAEVVSRSLGNSREALVLIESMLIRASCMKTSEEVAQIRDCKRLAELVAAQHELMYRVSSASHESWMDSCLSELGKQRRKHHPSPEGLPVKALCNDMARLRESAPLAADDAPKLLVDAALRLAERRNADLAAEVGEKAAVRIRTRAGSERARFDLIAKEICRRDSDGRSLLVVNAERKRVEDLNQAVQRSWHKIEDSCATLRGLADKVLSVDEVLEKVLHALGETGKECRTVEQSVLQLEVMAREREVGHKETKLN